MIQKTVLGEEELWYTHTFTNKDELIDKSIDE